MFMAFLLRQDNDDRLPDYISAHHRYPDNWKVPPGQLDGIYEFVADRARLARDAGKPFVVEEYGMQVCATSSLKVSFGYK
jgi:hypothetical protein